MASALSAKLRVQFLGQLTSQIGGGDNAKWAFSFKQFVELTNGTADDQADRVWGAVGRSVVAGAAVTLDIHDFAGEDIGGGDGNDAFGQDITLAEVCGLLAINTTVTGGGNLLVGGDGTTAAWNSPFNGDDDALVVVPPGGAFVVQSRYDGEGFAVTDTSNHLLKLASSAGTVTYTLVVIGRDS
jgi:hypothetical protein